MPQPPLFTPDYDFSTDLGTQHGVRLDATFDEVRDVTGAIIGNLGLIQRDDGQLQNRLVTLDSLAQAVITYFSNSGLNFRGTWVTATAYAIKDVVLDGTTTYVCLVANTSAALFATDLAAARWMIFSQPQSNPTAAQVPFTPGGTIAAVTVQGAIDEVAAEKAALAGLTTQPFDVLGGTTPTAAARMEQVQGGQLLGYAVATGTASAMLASIATGGISAFADGMLFRVRAVGINTSATPTLNLTVGAVSSGALTITRGDNGSSLAGGDIVGVSHEMFLQYRALITPVWRLLNTQNTTSTVRYNSGTSIFEAFNGTTWVPLISSSDPMSLVLGNLYLR